MSKHTPEPWWYDEASASIRFDGRGSAIEGNAIGCVIAEPNYRSDSLRIVACVNACKGMDDPAAEIDSLRATLAMYEAALKNYRITLGGTSNPNEAARNP